MKPRHADAGWPAVAECFRALCIGMDTPRSLKAALLLKHGELEQLVRMKIHPSEYNSADSFAVDYAIVNFLKKNPDMPLVCNRELAAITAFASSEDACRVTNETFDAWMNGGFTLHPSVAEVLHLAQRKVSRLLSVAPNLNSGPYSWGPGATFDLRRAEAYLDTKIVELPFTVTGSAWKHAVAVIDSDLHWKEAIIAANSNYSGEIFTIVPGGRYDTVPKTVLTDRSILVEPRLNTVLQKRIGTQIRDLLKRVGVDLNDQSRNQCLASNAITLDLATLDLEAASDSVSRKLVEYMLPPAWFEILDDLRSKWYLKKDGSWVRLEKFSSMGNGFTFELESLIFWALSSAVSELSFRGIVGVYGDDIIVHRDCVPLLTEVLRVSGFKLNAEKSFISGQFFESCGGHYFGGHDVTPAYQKCSPVTGFEACKLGNRLLRLASRLGHHVSLDKRVRAAWDCWRRRWDVQPDQYGPFIGEGDGYWESPYSQIANRTRTGAFGPWYRVACYGLVKREIPAVDEAMLAIWFMQNQPSHPWWIHGEGGYADAIERLLALPDSAVSLTGTTLKSKKVLSSAESGMIESRVKPRYKIKHRNVLGRNSTYLSW